MNLRLLFALVFITFGSVCSTIHENMLKNSLFQTYNKNTRPSPQIDLQVGIAIRAFNNIDQVDGTLTTNIWLRQYWKDPQLSWDPQKYGNLTRITLPTNPEYDEVVWTPDLYLYNTAELPMQDLDYSLVIINNDGSVFWSRPGIVKSTCPKHQTFHCCPECLLV